MFLGCWRVVTRINRPDAGAPPCHARQLMGKAEIGAYYENVCGRATTHRVTAALADGDRLAFAEACAYPDGKQVYCSAIVELSGSRIVRGTGLTPDDL